MTKYRIIKRPDYFYLHEVQVKGWWSWYRCYYGTLEECQRYLINLKNPQPEFQVVFETEI